MEDSATVSENKNLEGNCPVASQLPAGPVSGGLSEVEITTEDDDVISKEGRTNERDKCEIDPNILAASGAACCDLKTACNKDTLSTSDVKFPKDQIADLLSEGDGENAVTIAVAVPYSPLRVPSLAGDEPCQEPRHLLTTDHFFTESQFEAKNNEISVEKGEEEVLHQFEEQGGYTPLSKSSASIKTASSYLGSEGDICRICHLGPEQSRVRLVSPCLCSGTVEFTHHSCLTKWLAECGSSSCELCGYKFRFRNITAFRPTKLKIVNTTAIDRLHLLITLCTVVFLAATVLYVFWVAFSDNPIATRDRESIVSQILLPIYATMDAMAIFLLIFEFKHTIRRLWCKWRVLNLGVVLDDRETRMRNHLAEKRLEESGIEATTFSSLSPERNQLILQEMPDGNTGDHSNTTCEIFNDIFEPEVVVVEGNCRESNERLTTNTPEYHGNRL